MATVARRSTGSTLTDLLDWLESGWASMPDLRGDRQHVMRIEDRLEEDRYTVRAELPGIDPDKDVEISVAEGMLTISAERKEETTEHGRSEFHYGSFMRRVSLPPGAKEDELTATYQDGILQVSVPIAAEQAKPRTIPIARGPID